MLLQERSWNHRSNIAFDYFFNYPAFTVAPSHQHNLARVHNGAYSHRQAIVRDIFLAVKIACRAHFCGVIKRNKTSFGIFVRAGFICAHLSATVETDQLQINAAQTLYLLFIFTTKRCYILLWNIAAKQIDIFFRNINIIKKIFVKINIMTLQLVNIQWIIFVDIEYYDIFETQTLVFVYLYKAFVNIYACRACNQTKNTGTSFGIYPPYSFGNLERHRFTSFLRIRKNIDLNFLKSFFNIPVIHIHTVLNFILLIENQYSKNIHLTSVTSVDVKIRLINRR